MSEHRDDFNCEDRGGLLPMRTGPVALADLTFHQDDSVTQFDREGVYAHSYRCSQCQLEFALLSWVRDRYNADNTFCPECGTVGPKMHWRAALSDRENFADDGNSTEIFNIIPLGQNARVVSLPKAT